ncbi:MAG: 4Fe-4S binding protein [Ruminococcaceae bacterium]|nr:4Fe-4S binding protein [Oscillospiraceae bacterium]
MVLYYSSTGNSYHVAREISRRRPGRIIDMAKAEDNESYVLPDGETLFMVTFNCFWGVSKFVSDFFRLHRFSNVKKIVAVITCGGYLGAGDYHLNRILKAVNLPKAEVYELVMVTNYIVIHEVPDADSQKRLLSEAEIRLQRILDDKEKPCRSSPVARIFGRAVHSLYSIFRRTKPFTASAACIGCGKCAKDCPVGAIELTGGRPVWQKNICDHCLRCLHNCPVSAINYGRATLGKSRYGYPEQGES